MSIINIIKDAGKLKDRVSSIGKAVKLLNQDVHEVAISCLVHVVTSRNPELINNLCDHMKNAAHNNAMNRWFNHYGKGVIVWSAKAKGFTVNTTGCDTIESSSEMLEGLKNMLVNESKPYYELTPAPKYTPFILTAELQKLINKAEKKMEEPGEKDNFDGLNRMQEFLNKLNKGTSNVVPMEAM